jgi:hypothetical protein
MIRPAARIAASLADGDHVHDLVEAAVPGKREFVPDHLAAGSFDRRHACIRSEVSLAREARNVADYSQDLRCQDRPYTENLGEHGAGGLHLTCDALVESRYTSVQGAHISHQLGGQLSADPSGRMLGSSAAQQFGGGIGRELLPDRIREEVTQEYVEAVQGAGAFGDQVLASLGEQPQDFDVAFRTVLGLDRGQPIVSEGTEGNEVASRRSFLRALPVESTRTREESLGGTSTTLSPAARSFCAKGRPMPPAPSTAERRSGKRFAHRSRARSPFRVAGKVSCPTNSPCSSITATTFVALWGSTPMSTSTLVASLVFGPSPSWRTEDNPTWGKIHASVESPRSPDAGGSQAYNKPTLHKSGKDFASDPYRRPRSLAAADHRAPGQS